MAATVLRALAALAFPLLLIGCAAQDNGTPQQAAGIADAPVSAADGAPPETGTGDGTDAAEGSLATANRPDTPATAPGPGRGLLGLFRGARAPADAVTPGTEIAFGEVAAVCGLSSADLGAAVDQTPKEDGPVRWQLHDPLPQSTGPRSQYITGFRDRCARQVTGAMVMFGTAGVHEATRYDSANTRPYSDTDTAYEQVKTRLCGVRPGVPCPSDRLERLNDAVSFVTVYPAFGTTSDWFELLLVNGELEASAMSGR